MGFNSGFKGLSNYWCEERWTSNCLVMSIVPIVGTGWLLYQPWHNYAVVAPQRDDCYCSTVYRKWRHI